MRRLTPIVIVVALLVATMAPGGARAAPNDGSGKLTIPIAYRTHGTATSGDYMPAGRQYLQAKAEKPDGEWKLPKLVAEKPMYAIVTHGDQERLVVLEKKASDSAFYDRILYDANGNKDLTDDPKIDGELLNTSARSTYKRTTFPAVDTKVSVDGKESPFNFQVYLYGYAQSADGPIRSVQLSLSTNCSYAGEFSANGTKYRVVLGDSDGNGVFSDRAGYRELPGTNRRVMRRGDNLYITKREKISYYDGAPLSDLACVGGKAYTVDVKAPEGKIVLQPAAGEQLPVRLSGQAESLLLTSTENKTVAVYDPGETVDLPAGDYRLTKYTAYKKDEQGDLWMLSASGSSNMGVTEVKSGQTAIVQFGAPYKASIAKPTSGIPKEGPIKTARLSFSIVGSGGERVSALSKVSGDKTEIAMSKRNPDRPLEPKYKIVKSDGETVTSGSFEYG